MNDDDKQLAVQQPDPFIDMVERIAANPDIDADKVQKIIDAQMQVMDRNAKVAFYEAMNRVQRAIPDIPRDGYNPQTDSYFSKLETIYSHIKPVYLAEGFSTSFSTADSPIDGWTRIEGVLRHPGGHSERSHADLPLDDVGIKGAPNKTKLHGAASTLKYGQRYVTCLMFNIAPGEDRDGYLPKEPLSTDQATVISDLLDELKLPKQRVTAFLKWAKAKSVEDMPASIYDDAVRHLKELRDETS